MQNFLVNTAMSYWKAKQAPEHSKGEVQCTVKWKTEASLAVTNSQN